MDLGGTKVSTGQTGRRDYYVTPTGVFLHTDAILDWRAEGTFNENHIRGLGVKGMRVWDFGWQNATKGWGTGETGDIRLLLHATDPAYLERRIGHPASKGCVRIPAAMNRFLDRHGVLDAEYEHAAKEDPRFAALLLPDRTPTPLAGEALIIVDSAGSSAHRRTDGCYFGAFRRLTIEYGPFHRRSAAGQTRRDSRFVVIVEQIKPDRVEHSDQSRSMRLATGEPVPHEQSAAAARASNRAGEGGMTAGFVNRRSGFESLTRHHSGTRLRPPAKHPAIAAGRPLNYGRFRLPDKDRTRTMSVAQMTVPESRCNGQDLAGARLQPGAVPALP